MLAETMWRQAFRVERWARGISTSPQVLRERSINVVQLLGRAGAAPRIAGPEERPFVMFPLATSYAVKTKEENGSVTEVQKTSWHQLNVSLPWLQQQVLSYVSKGTRLLVNGRLSYHNVTREDGTITKLANVNIYEMVILGNPRKDDNSPVDEPESPDPPPDEHPELHA